MLGRNAWRAIYEQIEKGTRDLTRMIGDHDIGIFLLEFFVILLLARGAGAVFKRFRLPAVTAELLVGVALGPTVLGRFWPSLHAALFPPNSVATTMFGTVAWLGVLFLMLDTGLEVDFSLAWRQRTPALAIALGGLLLPLAVAYPLFRYAVPALFPSLGTSELLPLFLATAAAISAMPVAARALRDFDLLKTDAGLLTLSALAVKDILCWALFAILLALSTSPTASPLPRAGMVLVATLGFTALVLSVGRTLASRLFAFMQTRNFPEPSSSLTVTLLLGLLFGTLTARLGVHALFGFFLAGVLVGEAPSLAEGTRMTINQMVHAVFVPLFFVSIGLQTDLAGHFNVGLVLLLTAVEIALRYVGADLGARLTRIPRRIRPLIAVAHTSGGMMEIVLALLAYDAGILPTEFFVAILASSLLSSLLMGPWLAQLLRRRPGRASRATAAVAEPEPALLPADHILLDFSAPTRDAALVQLASIAAGFLESPALAPDILAAARLREQAMGTGIGHGIAIPHVRLPSVATPLLLLARPTNAIDWDAPDSLPADLLFFLIDPTGDSDQHVDILARIARAMRSPEARAALLDARTPDAAAALLRERM